MKSAIPVKTTVLALAVLLVLGTALSADAQRKGRMMGWHEDPSVEGEPGGYGPGMMGPGHGMMGGPGMMGQGSSMMGGHGMGMGPAMGMMGPYMAGCMYQLDLTEEQQEEMRSLRKDARREQMEAMLDVMDIRDDLVAEMSKDRPDPEKVRNLQETMSRKQAEMLEASVKNRNRIYDQLSEEQREQLREFQRSPSNQPPEKQRRRR